MANDFVIAKNGTSSDWIKHDFDKLISENPGYTQFPNFPFALCLYKHALLVFIYLVRCANRQKGGICFPSVKNISESCGIPSETTVREAIKELENRGLISKELIGRKNVYTISRNVYIAIDKANGIDNDINELEETPTYGGGIESEENEFSAIQTDGDVIPPEYDGTPPPSEGKHQHIAMPNKTKGIRLNNNIKKEEEQNSENTDFERVSTDSKVSTRGKANTFAKANLYFQALTAEEQNAFDIEALKLLCPDESNPKKSLATKRILRCRYFEELLRVHTVRLEGEQTFTIPAEI